jgi:hypothetical protein
VNAPSLLGNCDVDTIIYDDSRNSWRLF